MSMQQYCIIVLIHISLMVKNTDHLLMCLLATFISSFTEYILKFFAHFLDQAVSPIINILHQCGTSVKINEPLLLHYYQIRSMFLNQDLLFTLYILLVLTMYNNIYSQKSFTAPNSIGLQLLIFPFLSQLLVTTHLFTVCIVLPFPECHTVGIPQYIDFIFGSFLLEICF